LVRVEVLRLVELGSMPSEDDATVPQLEEWEARLRAVERPVPDEEARLLLGCFGPDLCFGGSWTLLHLIETAPGVVDLQDQRPADEDYMRLLLWKRAHQPASERRTSETFEP
jgi:hypothetical protein